MKYYKHKFLLLYYKEYNGKWWIKRTRHSNWIKFNSEHCKGPTPQNIKKITKQEAFIELL